MERKELVIYPQGFSFKIKFAGGGELPRELSGGYTSHTEASRAIQRYLTKRDKPNATAKARSTSKQVR